MLIGIDAGGTKNELVLCEKDGCVVNRLTAPGSNAADLGPDEDPVQNKMLGDILAQLDPSRI